MTALLVVTSDCLSRQHLIQQLPHCTICLDYRRPVICLSSWFCKIVFLRNPPAAFERQQVSWSTMRTCPVSLRGQPPSPVLTSTVFFSHLPCGKRDSAGANGTATESEGL